MIGCTLHCSTNHALPSVYLRSTEWDWIPLQWANKHACIKITPLKKRALCNNRIHEHCLILFTVNVSKKKTFSESFASCSVTWDLKKRLLTVHCLYFVYSFTTFDGNLFYYMEESVLLGTKPLVDSKRHFIRDPSGVFSVCHLCECRIVQWPHDSRLLLLLNWFLPIMKRTLHVGSKIWILRSRGKNNISLVRSNINSYLLAIA